MTYVLGVAGVVQVLLLAVLILRRHRRRKERKEYWLSAAESAMEASDKQPDIDEAFTLALFAGMCVDKANEAITTPLWKNAP